MRGGSPLIMPTWTRSRFFNVGALPADGHIEQFEIDLLGIDPCRSLGILPNKNVVIDTGDFHSVHRAIFERWTMLPSGASLVSSRPNYEF